MNIKGVSIKEMEYFEGNINHNGFSMKGDIYLNTAYVGHFTDDNEYGVLEIYFIRDEYVKKLEHIARTFFDDYENGIFGNEETYVVRTLKDKWKSEPIYGLVYELIELKSYQMDLEKVKDNNYFGIAICLKEGFNTRRFIEKEEDLKTLENDGCKLIKLFREESDFNFS